MKKKPRRYAEGTTVSVSRSREELERIVTRNGATGYMSGWDSGQALSIVAFVLHGRQVKIPIPHDSEEREMRRNWRVAILLVKARLELVASGDSTVETEFMPWIVLPNGQTIGELALPALAAGEMPKLLPGPTA